MNFSPTKQKEPLTWVEVNGKTKALTQSGNHYEKRLLHKEKIQVQQPLYG